MITSISITDTKYWSIHLNLKAAVKFLGTRKCTDHIGSQVTYATRRELTGQNNVKFFDPKGIITIYHYIIIYYFLLIQTKDEFTRRTASFDPVISSCFQHIFWSFLSLYDIEWSQEPSSLLPGAVYIVLHQIYKV